MRYTIPDRPMLLFELPIILVVLIFITTTALFTNNVTEVEMKVQENDIFFRNESFTNLG